VSGTTRIVTDANGRIVEASDGAADLLAIDRRRLVGKPLAAFVVEDSRQDFRALLLDLAQGDRSAVVSLELRRRDGAEMTADVEAAADENGERLEWLVAHAQLEPPGAAASVSKLEAVPLDRLLARLPHGIMSVNPRLDVEYLNPAAHKYLGATAAARVGDMVPEPWPEFSLRKFARRLFDLPPPAPQLVETASGRLLELDGIPAVQSRSGLVIMEDVTARERRRQAENAFVANVSHELRTPLAAIGSALEVLQSGAKENPSERDLFLAHLERQSDRLGRLAAALLLLARIQMGVEHPSLVLVEVEPLLEELAAELNPREGVEVRVSCGAGVAVLADADLLRQALWNIAANAAIHTRDGEISFTAREKGRVSEIEIRDTGIGMTNAEQERVFDRFFRGRGRGGSVGLGLAIAKEAVRALSGEITLESTVGIGTTVRVQLPSARLVRP
jgi:two-component system, OmpR family, phosphate regulon sensor histidine kinase PhoR